MTDQPTIDVQGQATPPRLSEAALADYRRLLNDPRFEAEQPERFAALKASVQEALAVTGQALNHNPDQRTPAQRHFDTSRAMQMSDVLRDAVLRDSKASAEPPDPEKAEMALAGIGMSYPDALRDAQHAVAVSPELAGVQVERLPPETLAQLAVFGAHHRKLAGQRPR